MSVAALSWPMYRLGEALAVLARRTGLAADTSAPLVPPAGLDTTPDECDRWVQWAGGRLGLEAESVSTTPASCSSMLLKASPAIVQVEIQGQQRILVLLGARWGRLRLVAPDLRVRNLSVDQVREALCAPIEAPLLPEINHVLGLAGMPEARRAGARRAMLLERLGLQMMTGVWMLRPRADSAFLRQLQQAGLGTRLLQMLALFALVYALEIGGWGLMGEGVLQGRLDPGWLLAWCLLLLTLVPIRLLASRLDIDFGLGAARVLKRRLLAGALKMDPDAVRHLGVGQLLGRVLESQSFEAQVVGGVLGVVMASVELLMAAWVLAIGAGSQLHLVLLAAWLAVTLVLTHRFVRHMRSWTAMRLDMTHDLVERMVGHRTRLAQEQPHRRDVQDDAVLQDYLKTSAAMDGAIARVSALIPGGWLLLGLLGLVPAFMAGGVSSAAMAIGFGGVLFANRAFTGISAALTSLAGAGLSWEQVGPFFKAAAKPVPAEPFLPATTGAASADERIIDAQQLVFRYRAQGAPVIDGIDLNIRRGEKILLQGPSGGGKSTLVALLTGLRQPESGLLLLQGLDRHTLGDAWHGLATEAPQFHENHILSGTLGFNLLMGRGWPASEADLEEARQLCIELGLGELLERMPAGLMQTVGETGWQLSHGERSRIFLARALLQKAPLTVMDESFAALDPRTLRQCLDCVLQRAETLVVVAHP